MNEIWTKYHQKSADRGSSKLIALAVPFLSEGKVGLDLGAGDLRDSLHLVSLGFERVYAIDSSLSSASIAKKLANSKICFLPKEMSSMDFPKGYLDFIHARNSLFFCNDLKGLFQKMIFSLKPGGVLAVDLLGSNDSWRGRSDIYCMESQKISELLLSLKILKWKEWEFDEASSDGMKKHWHYHKIIAKKPS